MLPKPWQSGHAPNGLLNENSRGCGTSYGMLHVAALEPLAEPVRRRRRSASSQLRSRTPRRRPSVYAVSIESVRRTRASASTLMRSTMTCSTGRSRSVAASDVVQVRRVCAVDVEPAEALAAERGERLGDRDPRGREAPAAATRGLAFGGVARRRPRPPAPARSTPSARTPTTGMSKPMSSRVPSGSARQPRRRRPRRFRGSLPCRSCRQKVRPTRA